MTRLTPLLDRNEQFARTYTPVALGPPTAQMIIVTCLDHRVDPAIIFGLGLGEAPVIRNAGGRITPAAIDDIAYLAFLAEQLFADQVEADRLFEVAIIHTNAEPGFSPTPASGIGPPRRPASPSPRWRPPPSQTRTSRSEPTSSACSPRPHSPPR